MNPLPTGNSGANANSGSADFDDWSDEAAWAEEGNWDDAEALFQRPDDGVVAGWSDSPPVRESLRSADAAADVAQRPAPAVSNPVPSASDQQVRSAPQVAPSSEKRRSERRSPDRAAPTASATPATPPPTSPSPQTRRGRRDRDHDRDDDFYDEEAFPPPRRARAFLAFLCVLVVLAGAVAFAGHWYRTQVTPSGTQGPKVTLTIPTNTSTAAKRI